MIWQLPVSLETVMRALLSRGGKFWVAHASGVLVSASRRNNLSMNSLLAVDFARSEKSAMARTPSPTRETRALPNPRRVHVGAGARRILA